MDERTSVVGRSGELRRLEEVFTDARPGLLLIVGAPGKGKRTMLHVVRALAVRHEHHVVPASNDEEDRPVLEIDKATTADDFRRLLQDPAADLAMSGPSQGLSVLLVYGYRPTQAFHEWFTETFVPALARANPPAFAVIAAGPSDAEQLAACASHRLDLGALDHEAVRQELVQINTRLADPMQDDELDAYADAVSAQPRVLTALRRLLPLTSAPVDTTGSRDRR